MKITIINWEKFNPRKDQKKHSWLRFENDFFKSESLFKATTEERIVYIYLLCEASRKNNEYELKNSQYVLDLIGLSWEKIQSALFKLRSREIIDFPDSIESVRGRTCPVESGPYVRTNDTNDTNERVEQSDCTAKPDRSFKRSRSSSAVSSGKPDMVLLVINYLNSKLGTNFSPESKDTIEKLNLRFKEGIDLDSIYLAIDLKHRQWTIESPSMKRNLVPGTLFSKNLHRYIDEAKAGEINLASAPEDKERNKILEGFIAFQESPISEELKSKYTKGNLCSV